MNREVLAIGNTGSQLVSKFNSNFKTSYQGTHFFNVEDYGAVHDGVTDDTVAIQAAINACVAAEGGDVFLPNGIYVIGGILQNGIIDSKGHLVDYNSQLYIPGIKNQFTTEIYVVRLIGEVPARYAGNYSQGVILKSTIAGTGVYPSVICSMDWLTAYYYMTYHQVYLENITIMVDGFKDTTGPSMCGVNFLFCSHCYLDNVTVHPDCTIAELILPDNKVFGIGVGFVLNDFPIMGSVTVFGFYYGIILGEGVHARDIFAYRCNIGVMILNNNYGVLIDYCTTHWNAYDLAPQQDTMYGRIVGIAAIKINFWAMEDDVDTGPEWTWRIADILDTDNLLIGFADYNTGIANGGLGHYITKEAGGNNLLIRNIYKDSSYHWTTAERPTTPGSGCTGFNTTTKKLETWDETQWNDCF